VCDPLTGLVCRHGVQHNRPKLFLDFKIEGQLSYKHCASSHIHSLPYLSLQLNHRNPDIMSSNDVFKLKRDEKFEEAAIIFYDLARKDGPESLKLRDHYSDCLINTGKYLEAELYNRETLRIWNKINSTEARQRAAQARVEIARCLSVRSEQSEDTGQNDDGLRDSYMECQKLLQDALQDLEIGEPIRHLRVISALEGLSDAKLALSEIEEATGRADEAQKLREEQLACEEKLLRHGEASNYTDEELIVIKWRIAGTMLCCSKEKEAQLLYEKIDDFLVSQRQQGIKHALEFDEEECQTQIVNCHNNVRHMRNSIDLWPPIRQHRPTTAHSRQLWRKVMRILTVKSRMAQILSQVQLVVKDPNLLAECLEAFRNNSPPRSLERNATRQSMASAPIPERQNEISDIDDESEYGKGHLFDVQYTGGKIVITADIGL
jgi:hypothetical protein